MKDELYKVFGLTRDATLEQIKKVYRRLAAQYHPDRNPGDESAAEKFKVIQEAWDILSDPAKKELYDRTGQTKVEPLSQRDARILAILMAEFEAAMLVILMGPEEFTHTDPFKIMNRELKGKISNFQQQLTALKEKKKKLAKAKGRSKVDAGENYFESMIINQLEEFDKTLESLDFEQKLHEEALDRMKLFKYELDTYQQGWQVPAGQLGAPVRARVGYLP